MKYLAAILLTLGASALAQETFPCNPGHSYPNGEACISTAGSLTLVSTAATAQTTYACNPAHQYPTGQTCTEINGSLTLIISSEASATMSVGSNETTTAGSQATTTAVAVSQISDGQVQGPTASSIVVGGTGAVELPAALMFVLAIVQYFV